MGKPEWTIERHEHGILVKDDGAGGGLPMAELECIWDVAKRLKLKMLDAGISSSLGAVMAITTEEGGKKWRTEIDAGLSHLSDVDAWRAGPDTGVSSITIWAVMTDRVNLGSRFGVPQDPDDFGRCFRLLEKFPQWRDRLEEVAKEFPQWGPLVEEWDKLEELWEEESPTGKCERLYHLMQQLIADGEAEA